MNNPYEERMKAWEEGYASGYNKGYQAGEREAKPDRTQIIACLEIERYHLKQKTLESMEEIAALDNLNKCIPALIEYYTRENQER